ncbi:hypothetical protein BVY04_04725 [bacterium M21]|nr:hypothetical protein BVY04_04725 [bacterium M21]
MYIQRERSKENKGGIGSICSGQNTSDYTSQFVDNRKKSVLQGSADAVKTGTESTRDQSDLQHGKLLQCQPGGAPMQCLLAGDPKDALETRCLDFETEFDLQTQRLPARFRWPADHPWVDTARAQLVLVRAALGVDDREAINGRLETIETSLAGLTLRVDGISDRLHKLALVLPQFGAELGVAFDDDLNALRGSIYDGTFNISEFNRVEQSIYRRVEVSNKDMKGLQSTDGGAAMALVRRYVDAGLVHVEQLNEFYCSPYDGPQDRFGAKARLSAGGSGKMQWIRAWEFHIHGEVTRAGGVGTPVNTFRIVRGHIKPTANKMDTGMSIQLVDPGSLAAIVNHSQDLIVRWANSSRATSVLKAQ